MANRRYTYVDFVNAPQPPMTGKNLTAVMVANDTDVDTFKMNGIGNCEFEMLQIGAAASTAFTADATGALLPIGTADGNGLAFCQGSIAADTPMKFVTGTDAFFIKAKLTQTVIADTDVVMIGFREAGTTQVTTTPALALTDYDHKALFGVQSNGGVNRLYSSVGAGSDTSTTPTITPNATTVEVTWEVRVSASRVVTVYVDGVEDALVTAAAITLTTAKTLVPHMIFVSTGAGVEQVNLATYECGLL